MKTLLPILVLLTFTSCSVESNKYSPDKYFSPKEKDALLWIAIRYLIDAPEGVNPANKFSPAYDSVYLRQMKGMSFDGWQKKGDTCFFLVSRLTSRSPDKRLATGGRLIFDDDGGLKYEEVFRTRKMNADTLSKRSVFLFNKMIMGESLKRFETRYSGGIEYIEFPNDTSYYDKEAREWKSGAML